MDRPRVEGVDVDGQPHPTAKAQYVSFEQGMSPEDAQRYSQWNKYAQAGIEPEDRVKLLDWDYPPEIVDYLENQNIYDNPDYFNQLNGKTIYPGTAESTEGKVDGSVHIDGFLNGESDDVVLKPGTIIDRFGDNGTGRYFSPAGTSFEARALSPYMRNKPKTRYIVIKPLPTKSGIVAPWFDQPGMGIQHYTKFDVDYLLQKNYISEVE